MGPRPKPQAPGDERALPPELLEPDASEILDVDVDAHLRWLETGEGEPWPPCGSSD